MSLFLDLIMLAIFLLFILIYAKKGFVKSIFRKLQHQLFLFQNQNYF